MPAGERVKCLLGLAKVTVGCHGDAPIQNGANARIEVGRAQAGKPFAALGQI